MKIRFTEFVLLLILPILFVSFQDKSLLHLIHADKSIGQVQNGEKVRILVGNVVAYQDTLRMLCNKAVFYEERNRADFSGNVLLDDGHHKLWCDKIEYFTDSRIAFCTGHVRISGDTDSLYAERFVYYFLEKNAAATENVFIWDKENDVKIWGDSGRYFAKLRESYVKGNSRLEMENESGDTLIITSREMEYHGVAPRHSIAKDSVKIFRGNVRAECDSAIYFMDDDMVWLHIDPIAWQDDNEMKGDVINLELDSLKIREIFLQDDAHLLSLSDSALQKYNLLRGKSIQVTINEGKLNRIISRKNASSVYLLKEKEEEQGTNSASSDSIIIYFQQGEMDSIAIIGGTEGIFYPADYKGEIKSEY